MANSRLCSIPDCGKPVRGSGLCNRHYLRLKRHGDPLGGSTSPGEALEFLQRAREYAGDECLIWPYANKRGYGAIYLGGRKRTVTRVLCEETYGPPIGDRNEAAHSCNNGHLGCVTLRHLSWKTRRENEDDRMLAGHVRRGEAVSNSKLTEVQVLEIRKLIAAGDVLKKDIAALYGVGAALITKIKLRERWDHI